MIEKMIVDADLCIKLGSHAKYSFLYDVLPKVAHKIYIHAYARNEVLMPFCAVKQLEKLITEDKIELVSEDSMNMYDRAVYKAAYEKLATVMIDPYRPNKNKGEVCSLAYAKATGIPVFATDEAYLQPIIDSQLNTGIDDIICLRIIDIVHMAREGDLDISRKVAKALWAIAGKKKEIFDEKIWPLKV
ncbi:MAG: hypothetical protein IJN72_01730 [Firmicutes bacterium]|nr:hypothetical protein [Bacillota bacterium]